MEDQKKSTEVLSPKGKLLQTVEKKLTELLTKHIEALPKNFNEARFLQNCLLVLSDVKDIEKCTTISIVRTISKGAYLGLDFFRKECYAIPYNNRDTGNLELSFATDYRGEIKLAKKYSQTPIHDIYAKLVREGDVLDIKIENGKQIINFNPLQFNDGEIIGVFGVVYFLDGSMVYDSMSKKEIEHIRTFSKAPNSPAWTKSWGEMGKKVLLRRITKMIDIDFDNSDQEEAYNDAGDADFKKDTPPEKTTVDDPFAEEAKKPEAAVEEATIIDPDAALKAELRKKYPSDEEWQIIARIKESREAK